MNIAVVGGHICGKKYYDLAYKLGKLIAKEGWVLVSGGKEGIMEAACKGASLANGLTVGILPGFKQSEANAYVKVKLPTGLGYARNVLVARSSDFIIAIKGSVGTLSEIAFAFNDNKTVIGIDTWDIPGVIKVKTPQEAINKIKKKLKTR